MKSITAKPDLTGRNTPIDMSKELRLLNKYMEAQGIIKYSAYAAELGVDRQALYNWLKELHSPNNEYLRALALQHAGKWQCDLAVELLTLRGLDVPCVCLESIGDNGPCPKHGAVEVSHAQA